MKSGGGSKDRHERIKICFVDRIPKDCMWQVRKRRNQGNLREEQVWEEESGSFLGHAKNRDACERQRGDVK